MILEQLGVVTLTAGVLLLMLSPNLIEFSGTRDPIDNTYNTFDTYTVGIFTDSVTYETANADLAQKASQLPMQAVFGDVCTHRVNMKTRAEREQNNEYAIWKFCKDFTQISGDCLSLQTTAIVMAMFTVVLIAMQGGGAKIAQSVVHVITLGLYFSLAATFQDYDTVCDDGKSAASALPYVWAAGSVSAACLIASIALWQWQNTKEFGL